MEGHCSVHRKGIKRRFYDYSIVYFEFLVAHSIVGMVLQRGDTTERIYRVFREVLLR